MVAKIDWQALLHDGHTSVEEMIREHHHGQGMTIEMIAEHFGVGQTALKEEIRHLGIEMKPRGGRPYSWNLWLKDKGRVR